MNLLSVNIGQKRPNPNPLASVSTGIYKQPLLQPVRVHALGLEGDTIGNKKVHGGIDQAVYVYGMADYDWWLRALDRPVLPGTFGDNLTVSELESAAYSVGDRFHLGEVVLEVTSPRIPCYTLAYLMEDVNFAQSFREAKRPGLYCRVIVEGNVQAGDEVTVERTAHETVTILEMFHQYYEDSPDQDFLRRLMQAPAAQSWKKRLRKKLKIG